MKMERYPADEAIGFISILLASGVPQIAIVFDWHVGEYIISWPETTSELYNGDHDED